MAQRGSFMYAPEGTCNKCGWSGKDWAFKYQGLCSKCYRKWKKEKAEERRKLKPPNENVEVGDGIIITTNVRDRLEKQAQAEIPHTKLYHCVGYGWPVGFLPLASLGVMYYLEVPLPYELLVLVCCGLGFAIGIMADRIETLEALKRKPRVEERLRELACERQQRIDEANEFYASAEWRLLRKQIIKEQGRVCRKCGRRITNDRDLTIDHVLPRSKFPDIDLDKSNMQILCRSCNASKSDALQISKNNK